MVMVPGDRMGHKYVLEVLFCEKSQKCYCVRSNNSTDTGANEKISADLESLEVQKIFDLCWTNSKILLHKINHCFLLSAIYWAKPPH